MTSTSVVIAVACFFGMGGSDAASTFFGPQPLATTFLRKPLVGVAPTTRLASATDLHPHQSGTKQLSHLDGGGAIKTTIAALRGGAAGSGVDDMAIAQVAFGWCANLGAPAALVGGAVLATLAGKRDELSPKKSDSQTRRFVKKFTRFLLASAFALEIIAIFVTTVMGTMLLAQGDRPTGTAAGTEYVSAMGFLRHNHEFEYLTARVTFLQGLFHWLLATAMELVIPNEGEGETARRMNGFISSAIVTTVLFMLSFYNAHMSFYENYWAMLWRYAQVTFRRYFWTWPMRPLSVLYIPSVLYTIVQGARAVCSPPAQDLD